MSGELGTRLGTNLIQEPRELGTDLIGWSPAKLSSLVAWWDPSPAYITLNGADVSAWTTRAYGSAYGSLTVSQGTAGKQPLYVSSSTNLNNQPAVRFTAANSDVLLVQGAAVTTWADLWLTNNGANPYTIYVGFYRAIAGANQGLVTCGHSTTAGSRHEWWMNSVDDLSWYRQHPVNGAETVAPADTISVGKWYAGLAADGVGTNAKLYRNATQTYSAAYTLNRTPGVGGVDVIAIGASIFAGVYPNAANFFDGDLGHIVICDQQLSGADLTNLQNFFASQYAI